MFYQNFLSPQVKRCVIITYKHGIYELPHELPNDLRKLGNFCAICHTKIRVSLRYPVNDCRYNMGHTPQNAFTQQQV